MNRIRVTVNVGEAVYALEIDIAGDTPKKIDRAACKVKGWLVDIAERVLTNDDYDA